MAREPGPAHQRERGRRQRRARAGTDTVLAFLVAGDGSRRLVAFDRVEPGRHHRGTAHLTFSAPAGSYKLVVGDLSRPIRVG